MVRMQKKASHSRLVGGSTQPESRQAVCIEKALEAAKMAHKLGGLGF